jgi:hypothetical protein
MIMKILVSQKQYNLIKESKDEFCSPSEIEEIRTMFNVNPLTKDLFKNEINGMLKLVYPKNYYAYGKYSPNSASGIYDLESEGRSVINKLNTNYSCFCQLKNDLNLALSKLNKPPLTFSNKGANEQMEETKRFIRALNYYKDRIFSTKSTTYNKLMKILTQTNAWGEFREVYVVEKLKEIFGENNVVKIGDLGSMKDMVGGVDCEIKTNTGVKTAQIKPYSRIDDDSINTTIYNSGGVTEYKTDWIIFMNSKNRILIFDNLNTKIVNGNFVIPSSDLLYNLV